jgi:hypothetical protein
MRWAFAGGAHPHADAILRDLQTQGSEAVVPILWRYEASAVLAVAQNKGTIPAHEVALFLGYGDSLLNPLSEDLPEGRWDGRNALRPLLKKGLSKRYGDSLLNPLSEDLRKAGGTGATPFDPS